MKDRTNLPTEDSRRTSVGSRMFVSSGLLGIEREQWSQDIDVDERTRFDQILEIVLSQLEPVCLSEQNFCISFFQLDVFSSSTKVKILMYSSSVICNSYILLKYILSLQCLN